MTVMTGSAAGPLGGNSGAAFGSGLTSFTLSPGEKVFNEFLTPWLKKSEEDKQIQELHRQEFTELSGKKLAEVNDENNSCFWRDCRSEDRTVEWWGIHMHC